MIIPRYNVRNCPQGWERRCAGEWRRKACEQWWIRKTYHHQRTLYYLTWTRAHYKNFGSKSDVVG